MSQLRGEEFSDLWPTLGKEDKQWLVSDLADIVARMHGALPLDGLDDLITAWAAYTATQAQNCVQQQRQGNLDEHWLRQIPTYLERRLPQIPTDFTPALLNTDSRIPI